MTPVWSTKAQVWRFKRTHACLMVLSWVDVLPQLNLSKLWEFCQDISLKLLDTSETKEE